MNKNTQAIYNKIQGIIGDESAKLPRGDYRELIEELSGHLQCLIDCLDEEDEHNES